MDYYSESFKRSVVSEYEAGGVSKEALRRKHRIGGKTTVLKWVAQYGRQAHAAASVPVPEALASDTGGALSQALRDAQIRIAYLETVLALGKEIYGLDLKKKLRGRL